MQNTMSKETALQIAMRITQRYANSLFDEHTARGRQFMQEMSECLELERDQINTAFHDGVGHAIYPTRNPFYYYEDTYKGGER